MKRKTVIRIPKGEIQIGHVSKSITIWFNHKKYRLKKGIV